MRLSKPGTFPGPGNRSCTMGPRVCASSIIEKISETSKLRYLRLVRSLCVVEHARFDPLQEVVARSEVTIIVTTVLPRLTCAMLSLIRRFDRTPGLCVSSFGTPVTHAVSRWSRKDPLTGINIHSEREVTCSGGGD